MLSYDKWKVLNESLGRATLGISQRPTIGGIISNVNLPPAVGKNEGWEDNELEGEEEDMGDKGVDLGSYHDEMGNDHSSYDDMRNKGSEEEIEEDDMEDEDDEDMEDEDMEDEDMEDEDDEFSDEEVEEDDEEEEDDEDSMGDKFKMRMGSREDSMGDEEEDMEMSDRPAPSMGMGETKKKNGQILSENDWWASVKNMVGQVQPNGSIKTEDTTMPSFMKPTMDKFEKVIDKELLDSASKIKDIAIFDAFMEPVVKALVEKGFKEQLVIRLRKMIKKLENEDQTAESM